MALLGLMIEQDGIIRTPSFSYACNPGNYGEATCDVFLSAGYEIDHNRRFAVKLKTFAATDDALDYERYMARYGAIISERDP
jgi:hypothetical protein